MRRLTLSLLAASALAACSSNGRVETTPTYVPARMIPPVVSNDTREAWSRRGAMQPVRSTGPIVSGPAAVAQANRNATVSPTSGTMRGATWKIDRHDQTLVYAVPLAPGRASTFLLPEGEKFSGAVGGNVDAFLINVAYAGPRPAITVLPRSGRAKGNLQLVTSGGFYSFDLVVTKGTAVNAVDIGPQQTAGAGPIATMAPQPTGDYTPLVAVEPDDGPLPAWAPNAVWADSRKLVVQFAAPLPTLPALFAGQEGEQMVSYRVVNDPANAALYLITNRRVTRAELRLGEERVRVTVDPDAVRNGMAADPNKGWQNAEPLAGLADQPNVAVVVVPGQPAATSPASTPHVLPPGAFGTVPVLEVPEKPAQKSGTNTQPDLTRL